MLPVLPVKPHMHFIITATLPKMLDEAQKCCVVTNWKANQSCFDRILFTKIPRWFHVHVSALCLHEEIRRAMKFGRKDNDELYAILHCKERVFDGDCLMVSFNKVICDTENICTTNQREVQRFLDMETPTQETKQNISELNDFWS